MGCVALAKRQAAAQVRTEGRQRAETWSRTMTITDRIEINPQVMMGKPVIRGTRIPVELVLRKLSEGATERDLLDAYPRLTPADIKAAIGYAAETLAHEETVLLGAPPSRKRGRR